MEESVKRDVFTAACQWPACSKPMRAVNICSEWELASKSIALLPTGSWEWQHQCLSV